MVHPFKCGLIFEQEFWFCKQELRSLVRAFMRVGHLHSYNATSQNDKGTTTRSVLSLNGWDRNGKEIYSKFVLYEHKIE